MMKNIKPLIVVFLTIEKTFQ